MEMFVSCSIYAEISSNGDIWANQKGYRANPEKVVWAKRCGDHRSGSVSRPYPHAPRVYLKTPQYCSILPKSTICCVAFACIPQRSAALMRLASGTFWRISQHFWLLRYTLSITHKYSVAQIMGYLKGKSSLMIFDRHANLKYKYGDRHFWARGVLCRYCRA